MSRAFWAAAALPAIAGALPVTAADQPLTGVTILRTAFVVADAAGRSLPQDELVGAVIETADTEGRTLTVRIDGWERDERDPTGEVVLYRLSTPDGAGGWADLCSPDADGRRLGFPLGGTWSDTGNHRPVAGSFGITCTAGAIGKCVRWGYRPWAIGPDNASMWDLHQACVRMVRADYCGDGVGWTEAGMPIDLFDRLGIVRPEPVVPEGMHFEAAWAADGAVCVHHSRVPGNISLEAIAARCPQRLAGRTGEACSEAATEGALLRNRSRWQPE